MGKGRAPCCDKTQVKRGPWSPAEDLRLITFIQKNGHDNWRALPKLSGLKRCGKSCRLRWINYLRPDVKRGNFTKDEEEGIIKLHKALGNKWAKIASHFPGRTDNEIKNVWNTHLKKRSKLSNDNDKPSRLELKNLFSSLASSSSTSSAISTVSQLADGSDREENDDHVLKEATNEEQATISSTATISSNSFSASNLSNSIIRNPIIDGDVIDGEEEILLVDALVFDNESEPDEVNDLLSDVSKPENKEVVALNHEELVSWPEAEFDFWDLLDGHDTSTFDCDMTIDDSKPNAELDESKKWLRNLESELGLDGEATVSEEDQSQQQVLDHPIDQTMIDAMFSIEIEEPELSHSWDMDL